MKTEPTRASHRATVLRIALLVLPVLLLAFAIWQRRWIADDGFINLRIVRNLHEGHGLVFNIGERIEAGTSPMWLFLLALFGLFGRLEYVAVILGLVTACAGLGLAMIGAARLGRPPGAGNDGVSPPMWAMPMGALVIIALPPVWDFGTSGLETGLSFCWIGGCFAALAALATRQHTRSRSWWLTAALIGLGPMVRPDLALYSMGYIVVLLLGLRTRAERWRWQDVVCALAAAGAIPVAFQIFRMGYYAALVPNTALAKEAFESHWQQGWHYLRHAFDPYVLYLPLFVLIPAWHRMFRAQSRRSAMRLALVLVPPICAVLSMLYVIRLGGGFMHARLLLPSIFGLLTPIAALSFDPAQVRARPTMAVVAGLVVAWALVCASSLRVDPANKHEIGDERHWYASEAGVENPVLVEDYAKHEFYFRALALGGPLASRCPGQTWPIDPSAEDCDMLLVNDQSRHTTYPQVERTLAVEGLANGVGGITARGPIGISGYVLGSAIFMVDRVGLADPIAARLEVGERSRPGHKKYLRDAWLLGRFSKPGSLNHASVIAAQHALGCGELAELQHAITAPLDAGLFFDNIVASFRFHRLRIPNDPFAAEDKFCGTRRSVVMFGGDGGQPDRWHCPTNAVLVGLNIGLNKHEEALSSITPVCRDMQTKKSVVGPQLGREDPPDSEIIGCPKGTSITGLHGRADHLIRGIGVACHDQREPERMVGFDGGAPTAVTCPEGENVRGLVVRTGDLVDAVGLACE